MRTSNRLALTITTSVVALLSGYGCSAEPEGGGGGNTIPGFGQPGGGAAGNTGTIPGGAGNTGTIPGGGGQGSNPEGQGGNLGVAQGGQVGTSGAAGDGPIVDVVTEPGPGFFVTGEWKGYAWTAIESDPVQGATTRTPIDFTMQPDGEPFCLQGTVAADPPSTPTATDGYQGFAMMGFNINQAGVPEVEGAEPPVLTAVPTGNGIAFSFTQTEGPLRVQIQGADPTNPAQRWCAAVEPADAQGRGFIPYTAFHQTCYAMPPLPAAGFYGAGGVRAPLAAVSFQVPGNTTPIPYNFCIGGFADAQDITGAPASISGGGLTSGTLATNFGRAKVRGADGKSYVVQNNAWNTAAVEGNHRLSFVGNSFTVTRQSNGGQGSIPISFPSIFVGRNGFRGANEIFTTSADDNLPRAINQIQSINTTFRHNGGAGPGGEYNITYDIWFANSAPAGEYDDASAAFLMVWLHKPAGKNPIGINPFARNVQIAGSNWDIWVGPRGENGAEDNANDNAPVISYTPAGGTIGNFQANLMAFINDAVQRSSAGGLNGFQFGANLVLTDIFGGAEIWSGGENLAVSEFTVNVQ